MLDKFLKYFRNKKNNIKYYFIGLPKTASTSLAQILMWNCDMHEFWFKETIISRYRFKNGDISREELNDLLKKRENAKNQIFDISTFNFHNLDFIISNYPNSKFFLPIRDPYSWANSFLNHIKFHFSHFGIENWHETSIKLTFGESFGINNFQNDDEIIKILKDIIPILCIEWAKGITETINTIPYNSTLIYRYSLLSEDISFISKFTGIPVDKLNIASRIENVAPSKTDFIATEKDLFYNNLDKYSSEALLLLKSKGISDFNNFTWKII